MGTTSFADAPPDETNLTGVGEIRLTPDLSTMCRIPWYEISLRGILLVYFTSVCMFVHFEIAVCHDILVMFARFLFFPSNGEE